jgi:APA family basic amino acid/polyamine antiporter
MIRPETHTTSEGLVRALGVPSAALFVVGSVIGSGIFLTTGLMANVLPSATLLLVAWTVGGLLALAGGLTYAELGTMFPRSGGLYVFLTRAYGPTVGFLYGWTALLVVLGGGIAAVAVGFADYVAYFVPALGLDRSLMTASLGRITFTVSAGQMVAVASIAVLGAVNYRGVAAGNVTNVVLTVAKVAGLAAIPLMALSAPRARPRLELPALSDPSWAAPFGVAMIAVFWAYEGWYFLTFAAGEVREPHRTLPRALVTGCLALTAIYVGVNLAYLFALPMDEIRGVSRIGERAASALVGGWGATFVSVTVLVSTLGANAAALLAGPRLLFAMAEDDVFFRAAAAVHPRFHTPHVAIVALAIWSSVLAVSGTYEQLFTYVAFVSLLFSAAGGAAVFVLRRTLPHHPRPYRVWGYPLVPGVLVVAAVAFVVNTLFERPLESLAGLGFLAAGLPVFLYWRRSSARAPDAPDGSARGC